MQDTINNLLNNYYWLVFVAVAALMLYIYRKNKVATAIFIIVILINLVIWYVNKPAEVQLAPGKLVGLVVDKKTSGNCITTAYKIDEALFSESKCFLGYYVITSDSEPPYDYGKNIPSFSGNQAICIMPLPRSVAVFCLPPDKALSIDNKYRLPDNSFLFSKGELGRSLKLAGDVNSDSAEINFTK